MSTTDESGPSHFDYNLARVGLIQGQRTGSNVSISLSNQREQCSGVCECVHLQFSSYVVVGVMF